MAALALAVVFLLLLAGQQLALRDLRRIEADFMAAREPTACANQRLIPLAFGDEGADLDATIAELLEEAAVEVAAVRRDHESAGGVLAFPPLRDAHTAVSDALRAQDELYQAMLHEPADSEEQLRVAGRALRTAERRLARARQLLLVGPAEGWERRYECDEEPPRIPAP